MTTYVGVHADVKPRTIFGREPAMVSGFIETVLTLLLAFGLGVDQSTFGPILAVVVAGLGLYVAWGTKDTWLGAIIGFLKAGFILAAVYGFSLTDGQTGAILMVVTAGFSFLNRTQTSPLTSDGDVLADPVPVTVDAPPVGVQPDAEPGATSRRLTVPHRRRAVTGSLVTARSGSIVTTQATPAYSV